MQAAVPGCFVKRWWGRGPQKLPPETFVRGLAVPPCSTPVTMPKKDPKKLCAFWGFISVPVVGVEPTRCHHQRILSPSRLPIPTHRREGTLTLYLHWGQMSRGYPTRIAKIAKRVSVSGRVSPQVERVNSWVPYSGVTPVSYSASAVMASTRRCQSSLLAASKNV